jgi:hypothetical protein
MCQIRGAWRAQVTRHLACSLPAAPPRRKTKKLTKQRRVGRRRRLLRIDGYESRQKHHQCGAPRAHWRGRARGLGPGDDARRLFLCVVLSSARGVCSHCRECETVSSMNCKSLCVGVRGANARANRPGRRSVTRARESRLRESECVCLRRASPRSNAKTNMNLYNSIESAAN